MRRALAILQRVEHGLVERRRLELAAIDQGLAEIKAALARLESELELGWRTAWGLPDGPRLLAAYVARGRREQEELQVRQVALRDRREAALDGLRGHLAQGRSIEAADRLLAAEERLTLRRRGVAAAEDACAARAVAGRAPAGSAAPRGGAQPSRGEAWGIGAEAMWPRGRPACQEDTG